MTEQHTIHLPVIRYRDKAGNPTCAAATQTTGGISPAGEHDGE